MRCVPPGAWTSTTSPSRRPRIASPTGDPIEIRRPPGSASIIAQHAGANPPPPPSTMTLRAQLFGTLEPSFLEATLDHRGKPLPGGSRLHAEAPWWPAGTLFGRHLTPWMARQALTRAPVG